MAAPMQAPAPPEAPKRDPAVTEPPPPHPIAGRAPPAMGLNLRTLLEEMVTVGARPICTSSPESASSASTARSPALTRAEFSVQRTRFSSRTRFSPRPEEALRDRGRARLLVRHQNLARFRGNCFKQRGCVSMVIRQIPFKIKTFEDLGLPPVIAKMAEKPRGLVLVTGPTGSGKSTTLAAMIDKINRERQGHIITVEDPIEFIHKHQGCIINQREVGTDTKSFASRAQVRAARRSRRDPRRRNARPGDDPGRAHHRRDGSPGVRDAAHELGGRSDQPHHRRVPDPPAVAGARAARVRARGDRHADAAPESDGARAARWRRRSWSSRRPFAR